MGRWLGAQSARGGLQWFFLELKEMSFLIHSCSILCLSACPCILVWESRPVILSSHTLRNTPAMLGLALDGSLIYILKSCANSISNHSL